VSDTEVILEEIHAFRVVSFGSNSADNTAPAPSLPLSHPLSLILSYLFVAIQKIISLLQHIPLNLQLLCLFSFYQEIFTFSTDLKYLHYGLLHIGQTYH
jgi:hypothetical protein